MKELNPVFCGLFLGHFELQCTQDNNRTPLNFETGFSLVKQINQPANLKGCAAGKTIARFSAN